MHVMTVVFLIGPRSTNRLMDCSCVSAGFGIGSDLCGDVANFLHQGASSSRGLAVKGMTVESKLKPSSYDTRRSQGRLVESNNGEIVSSPSKRDKMTVTHQFKAHSRFVLRRSWPWDTTKAASCSYCRYGAVQLCGTADKAMHSGPGT